MAVSSGRCRMFQQCEEPRFTIQQIDLLQRLRRTGITPGEVVHALDTLEHLEGTRGRRPPASSMTSSATQTSFPETHLTLSPNDAFVASSPPLQISGAENGFAPVANGKLSPPRFPLGAVGGAVMAPGFGFDTNEEDVDVDEKVEELMR